ncbi:MAG TPA: FHA domain-containing protein [Steroidobacteraceae bacterium]
MATENHTQESDLDKTDKLPILEGVTLDPDVADDAVRMDHGPRPVALSVGAASPDFIRAPIDLPSLAESVRSVEERIARQSAELHMMTRAYERAHDAETAANQRAAALEKDLTASRVALESEQSRSRDIEKASTERAAAAEAARKRVEESLLESERHQAEARTLREALAAREATIVQVLHSLGERDAQLAALQQEHAKVVPALEERAKSGTQLEVELTAARRQVEAMIAELKAGKEAVAELQSQCKRNESDISSTRSDLAVAKSQAASHLELLRSRDWRRGFDLNMFRELDARAGAADSGREALHSQRDQLQAQVAKLEAQVSAHAATIEQLQGARALQASAVAQQVKELHQVEQLRSEWASTLAAAENEQTRLSAELATRDQALIEARANAGEDRQRIEQMQRQHAAQIAEYQAEAETHDQEMTVLMAHLKEARRPIEAIEGDAKRVSEQLAAKSAALDAMHEETGKLRAALERTRGALEEREFLIRRLERSESNNANALGRIQTSMERLGSPAAPPAPAAEWAPEMVRIDGDRSISHPLGRRTRIGRAPGCELHIDSSSVSRHHALILAGTREAIIEDLNSTNGVMLNGRKVTRQVLNDGDIVTIGEIQFRYVAKPVPAPQKG